MMQSGTQRVVQIGRPYGAFFLVALGACDALPGSRYPDGGAPNDLHRPLVRACTTEFSFHPDSAVASVSVAGEFNKFDQTANPLTLGSDGTWRGHIALRPGAYGYKFVTDGNNWLLDPNDAYTKFVGDTENSLVEVDDCNRPQLKFLSLQKSAGGDAELQLQYVDGHSGAGFDSKSLEIKLDGAAQDAPMLSAEGNMTVRAHGLTKNKHRFVVSAADRAGHPAEELHIPFWIEDQPFDFRQGLFYFAFTDRFRDGDPASNLPLGELDDRANYFGGDFAGVRAAIEEGYFDALGVRTLWLSPPNANPDHSEPGSDGRLYSGYHGYWPTSSQTTESRFGSIEDLRALIHSAHARGIRVLVDTVLNHVHKEHPYFVAHQSDGWFSGDGTCVCGAPNCDWTAHALDCWFMSYLPDLNYRNFDALRAMVDDALFWARDLDIDGFRVDAVKHFEEAATRRLRSRLRDEFEHAGPLYYLVGETFDGDRDLVNHYVGPTKLHAQFDFPLYFTLTDVLARGKQDMYALENSANASDKFFGTAPMAPFVGNHDVPRFVSLAAGDVDEGNAKEQAWKAPPSPPQDEAAYRKLRLALTFVATQPGVPLVYYGDEFGQAGSADPDNRRPMKWSGYSKFEQATLDHTQRLGKARTSLRALQVGDRKGVWTENDIYVYARVAAPDVAIVALNRAASDWSRKVPLPSGVTIADGTVLHDRLGGNDVTVTNQSLDLHLSAQGSALYAP